MTKRPSRIFYHLAVALFALSGLSNAVLADQAAEGKQLALRLCSNCHIVADGGTGVDAVPSFRSMANKAAYPEARLRAWLFNPHPPMPAIHLSTQQVDSVVAYIQSLKKPSNQ